LKGLDLDIRNPNKKEEEIQYSKNELIGKIKKSQSRIIELLEELS